MITRLELYSLAMALVALLVGMSSIAPLSGWWFAIHRFEVSDARTGDAVVVDYDRTIAREFTGEWRVEVEAMRSGLWESYCATPTTRQTYDPERTLPDPVTLEWLAYTSERCWNLPEGVYRVSLYITINPGSYWRREVQARSGPFRIGGDV